MAIPQSVLVDGREYLPKMPAPNVIWTLGQYLIMLREAAGYLQIEVACSCSLDTDWLDRLENDQSDIYVPFGAVIALARLYHTDLELLALCYQRTQEQHARLREETGVLPAVDDTDVAPDETDEAHDNESAVVTDYLALAIPEPSDEA